MSYFLTPSTVGEAVPVTWTPREIARLTFCRDYMVPRSEDTYGVGYLDQAWLRADESPYQKQQEFQANLVQDPGGYHYHEVGGHLNKCYAQHPFPGGI